MNLINRWRLEEEQTRNNWNKYYNKEERRKIQLLYQTKFTSLIYSPQPDATVVRGGEIQVLSEDEGRYRISPCFHFQEDKRFEIYSIEIDPKGTVNSESHREGTEEFITVFDGEVTIRLDEAEYKINKGDSIRFKADRPHTYYNSGDTPTRLSMTIYYPVN